MMDGRLTIWTVFKDPSDFPGKIVVVLDFIEPGRAVRYPERWFATSIRDARRFIHSYDPTADKRLAPGPDDPPSMVECWL